MTKQSIIEFFYEHVDENDWYEGIDLYQAGKLSKISDYQGLVSSRVDSGRGEVAEVRLKIHPNGSTIQWIECTCRKNRLSGRYCEHMSAFMFGIDREKPELFKNLDAKTPFKPPSNTRKQKGASKETVKIDDDQVSAVAAAPGQKILSYLEGSIHSAQYINQGAILRVRIEIKAGQLMNYQLDVDGAAKYLQANPRIRQFSDDLDNIKIYEAPIIRGSIITQTSDETIQVDKVIAIKHTQKSAEKAEESGLIAGSFIKELNLHTSLEPKGKKGLYEFIPAKAASKYLGKEFFFAPNRGYWPIDRQATANSWDDQPHKRAYEEDAAAELVASQFQAYLQTGPIWLDDNLTSPLVLDQLELSQISIIGEEDGWFFLDPKYAKGDVKISMLDLLRQAKKKNRNYVRTGKTWVKIPEFVRENEWEFDPTGQFLKVDSIGLMRIKAAVGDFDHFVGSKKLLNTIRNRVEFDHDIKSPPLSGSGLNLREYQDTGFKWLWWLYKNRLHGLLADEMGLGKTHQAMALLYAIQQMAKESPRFLIIAPTTVLDHWEDKIRNFCPTLNPLKHHGPKRTKNLKAALKTHPTMITSYGILLKDIKDLATIPWDVIILDEAHFVKNNDTATYHAVCKLQGHTRLCLTGTPIENHLGELKNIFDFLVPGYLGSEEFFKKQFMQPIQTAETPEREIALQRLIHPFKMRRTKELVLKDLPAKVEDKRSCELSTEQAGIYRRILEMKASPLIQQLKDDKTPIPFLHVFATITLLKQVCDHPAMVLEGSNWRDHQSGKFEALKELLDEALGSGHKVVIFSQYVTMISIIASYLTEAQIGHAVLTGQTRNRGALIQKFQEEPDCKVFVGSLLAGGIGIDLTAASVVIHYDRWWNASKENQATDRIHRIGQNKNVQVFKLLTKGTLEEKIDQLIASKQKIFEKFMDQDEEIFKTLTREQLIDLLQ